MQIKDLFEIKNAKSKGFSTHLEGDTPFISNGTYNNGVVGFVEPIEGERLFQDGITVSAFGDAIVQKGKFLPRGNGGSGLTVLIPKNKMSDEELYSYAAEINAQAWRFSYSRMVTKDRISHLPITHFETNKKVKEQIEELVPKDKPRHIPTNHQFKWFKLTDVCSINKKSAPPQNQMSTGNTPYVTTSSKNNGVSDYVDAEPNAEAKNLSISLNGSVGEAFFQFDDFVTSGDNAILKLHKGYNPYTLLFIAFLIRRQRWRYNYYRKLTLSKLKKVNIPLPISSNGKIDENYIKNIFENTYGFETVKCYL